MNRFLYERTDKEGRPIKLRGSDIIESIKGDVDYPDFNRDGEKSLASLVLTRGLQIDFMVKGSDFPSLRLYTDCDKESSITYIVPSIYNRAPNYLQFTCTAIGPFAWTDFDGRIRSYLDFNGATVEVGHAFTTTMYPPSRTRMRH